MVLDLISLSFQTYIPFLLFYNHCDKSELHVFGPFLFCLRVSWYGGPIRVMNIQELDEQELCRQIYFKYFGGMSKDCVLRMQGYGWLWQ